VVAMRRSRASIKTRKTKSLFIIEPTTVYIIWLVQSFFFGGGPGWLRVHFERVGSIICCHPTPPCNCGNGSNNIGGGRRGGVDQGKKGGYSRSRVFVQSEKEA
jgi:hypothetical protein